MTPLDDQDNASGWTTPRYSKRPDEFRTDRSTPACYQWPLPVIPPIPDGTPKRRRLFCYDVLREWQDGRCALCGGRQDGFFLDHCHVTGLARGFLCHTHNLGMDKGSGDPARVAYELRPATVVIGMAPQYRAKSNRWDRPQAWIEAALGPCPVDDPIAAAPYLERALALIEAEQVESWARMGDVWREHWSVTEARSEAREAARMAARLTAAPPRGRVVSEYVVSKVGVRLSVSSETLAQIAEARAAAVAWGAASPAEREARPGDVPAPGPGLPGCVRGLDRDSRGAGWHRGGAR